MNQEHDTIRLLPASSEPASAQLAAGAALLKGLEESAAPVMRWYRVSPTALLLGSSQRPDEIDPAACSLASIAVHRRGSGGGVVLAGEHLLLLDLAIPRDHRLYINDVTRSYTWLGEVWAAALQSMGLEPQIVPIDRARADTRAIDPLLKRVCYGALSPYEVTVGGRKVVGLAQIRRRGGALLQAGVYLRWEPKRTAALLAAGEQQRAALADQLRTRVGGLDDLLGRRPEIEAVTGAVEAALAERTGLMPSAGEWTPLELEARREAAEQYPALG